MDDKNKNVFEAMQKKSPVTKDDFMNATNVGEPERVPAELAVRLEAANVPEEVHKALLGANEIIGKYLILNQVGRGGSGSVYRAFDLELMRIVALKKIRADSDKFVQRARNEALFVAKLNHPGIPKIFDTSTAGEICFIAMEYVDGTCLHEMEISQQTAVAVCRDVANILDYAHSQGIVHRDIKPSNIMLDKSGRVWVTDFGIAKMVGTQSTSQLTRTGEILGTPHFMSPEQAKYDAKDVDGRSDIFSLGSTLYYLLTSSLPFDGSGVVEIMAKITSEYPPLPSVRDSRVPKDLDAVVFKAMEKEKERRYAAAKEMAEDLGRFLVGETVRARPIGWLGTTLRKLQRHKKLATLTALGIAGLITAGVITYNEYRQRSEVEKKAAKVEEESTVQERALREMVNQFLTLISNTHEDALKLRRGGAHHDVLKNYPDRVIGIYNTIIARGIKEPRIHFSLGGLYRMLGQDEKAAEQQKLALNINPAFAPAHYEMGMLEFKNYRTMLDSAREEKRRKQSEEMFNSLANGGKLEGLKTPPDSDLESAESSRLKASALDHFQRATVHKSTANGVTSFLKGDSKSAQDIFGKILEKDPAGEDAVELQAELLKTDGKLDEAIKVLSAGIEVDKGNTLFLLKRAAIHYELSMTKEALASNPLKENKSAIDDLTALLVLDSENDFALALRGNVRNSAGLYREFAGKDPEEDYSQAVKDLSEAIRLNSTNSKYFATRGGIRVNTGVARQSHGLDPTAFWKDANDDFEKALAIDSADKRTWMWRGNLLQTWGNRNRDTGKEFGKQWSEAMKSYDKAISLDTGDYESWMSRGFLWSNIGSNKKDSGKDPTDDYKKALDDMEKAIKNYPAAHKAWMWRGMTLSNLALYERQSGLDPWPHYEEALKYVDKSISLNPNNSEAYTLRGLMRSNRGVDKVDHGQDPTEEYRNGISDFATAASMKANDFQTQMYLGILLMNYGSYRHSKAADPMKEYEESDKAFATALKLNATSAHIWQYRGVGQNNAAMWQETVSRFGDASAYYRRAADFWRNAVKLNSTLGQTLAKSIEAAEKKAEAMKARSNSGDY